MRRIAIIQARMGSTRLPGKVLRSLRGKPVLHHVLGRVSRARSVDGIVLATTRLQQDNILAAIGTDMGLPVVRGDVNDVLSRYAKAARLAQADTIIRITSDCPCIDPGIIDRIVAAHEEAGADYTSNVHPRSFPHGIDVEVIDAEALYIADREATDASHREHVTPFIWSDPQRFRLQNVEAPIAERVPHLRVTLDTYDDYLALQTIFALLASDDFTLAELLGLVRRHPWLVHLNRRGASQ